MTENSLTLSSLAAECKRLVVQVNRAEDNEVRARNIQNLLDSLIEEVENLNRVIEIKRSFQDYFPETARSEFKALPTFNPTPTDVAEEIMLFEDFDNSNEFSVLQEKVQKIINQLKEFRLSSNVRGVWDQHRTEKLQKIFKELDQVENLEPDQVSNLKSEIKAFNSSGKVLNGDNVKALHNLISRTDALRDTLELLPEKVKKFLNLIGHDQPGAALNALENSDVSAWIEENNFKKKLVIRMKDS